MQIELRELAERLGAEIGNPPAGEVSITGLAALRDAAPSDLSFYNHPRYLEDLKSTRAGAVLVARDADTGVTHVPLLAVDSPSLAFDSVTRELLAVEVSTPPPGVHPSAVLAPDVEFDPEQVSIGSHATVGAGSDIGPGAVIGAGVSIGERVSIGAGSRIYPNAVLYDRTIIGERVIVHAGAVLGADGFGFEFDGSSHQKIDHYGVVELGDDVEIGANSTIDRGRFGRTSIGTGTKIDNLVQIGHNVTIGKNCVIVADSAIAGSTRLGDHVTVAAQVGFAGHLEIGSYCVFVARTGVTKSVPGGTPEKPAIYSGFPVSPIDRARKEMVYPRKVPDILARLKALEEKLGEGE